MGKKINIRESLKQRDLDDFENDRGYFDLANSYDVLSEDFSVEKKKRIAKMILEHTSSKAIARYLTEDEDISVPATLLKRGASR